MNKKIFIFSIIFIIFDQLIKFFISNNIILGNEITIINDFFSITNVHNFGAAWSLFSGSVIILVFIAFVALFFIYFSFIHKKNLNNLELFTYSLLIGGIVGNLIDRIFLGYVVDYLSFNIFGYMFPIFNLADIGIVISVFIIIIMSIQEEIECKKLESKKI